MNTINARKRISEALYTIAGALVYVGLNWIPVVGPLATGFIVGQTIKADSRKSFNQGILAGTIGFVILMFLMNALGIFNMTGTQMIGGILVAWILFIWNAIGILLCGAGAMVGSLFSRTSRMLEGFGFGRVKEYSHDYRMCPECGFSFPDGAKSCSNCGLELFL